MMLIGSTAFAYYNLGKTEITLILKNSREPISLTIHAGSDVDSPRRADKKIPAKKEFIEGEKVYEFSSTGSSENMPISNRATGKVVIYNQYSKDPQPLVKNTRLEGANGLIFRIASDVVVPGKETSGKPGEVTVEVFADGEGDEFQIEPTDFKIVGFKGSPKYDSFYAKSFEKFVLNKEGNIQKKVTSDDVLNARKKSVEAAINEGKNMLHDAVPVGRYIFDEAIDVEARIIECNAKPGDLKDKFNCQVLVKATTVSVSTDDVKSLTTEEAILRGANEASNFSIEGGINYILIKEKIDQVSLDFEVKTDINISSYIDEKNFIKGILGKKESEALSYISSYPGIEKGELKFFPFFIKRIPFDESKIILKLN